MSRQGRGVVLLAAGAAEARAWVRRGVVPCHVAEHGGWSLVAAASARSAADAPYDDAATVLAARHVGHRLAPAIGFFVIGEAAVVTVRARGRAPTRWALRGADHRVGRGRDLPPLPPEHVHRVLGSAGPTAAAAPVPIRALRAVWERTDLAHLEWLLEVMTTLGLPGGPVLAGTDIRLGPRVVPDARSVATFESVVKDVHQ